MKTLKAIIAVALVTFVAFVAIFALVRAGAGPTVAPPERIAATSVCPVAGCTSDGCHGADPAPELTAGQTMTCPKVGCEAESCHAADRLTSHYQAPKNSSLNVWILGLSVFTIAMISIALYVK